MRGNDECGLGGEGRGGHEARLGVHVVAGEEIDTIEGVAGNEAGDFIQHGERIEGAEFGLEAVGLEPDGVAVGLAGLRAARLAEIGGDAARFACPKGTSVLTSTPMAPARRTRISKSGLTPARSAALRRFAYRRRCW